MPEPGQPPVVLLVEDHPLNMTLAADLLTLAGFKVLQATDGQTALEVAKAGRPNLVLLDIRLPDIDGFEVLRRLRVDRTFASTKVVALTASVMREEAERIMERGFDGYIPKPIDTKQFAATVRGFLD